MSPYFISQAESMMTGVAIKHFGPSHLKKMNILVPPLETQKHIVAKIEEEQKIVEANKKLIDLFQQKIEARIKSI